jgi:hypothetical protein
VDGGGWKDETITVVARTYPECSKKYGCLVCTAGITDKGEWRRLYPIPWALFWGKDTKGNHGKWDIISIPTRKTTRDRRPESYEVDAANIQDNLKVVGRLDGWDERRKLLEPFLAPDLEGLWGGEQSLGLVKPREVDEFLLQPRDRIRDPDEELTLEKTEQAQQTVLGDWEAPIIKKSRTAPEPLPWIGYRFTCKGRDCRGHRMMCIDWEIQALYRKYGEAGFEKVQQKAMELAAKDLFFVVGTTWRFKTWMIIGLFYPPHVS